VSTNCTGPLASSSATCSPSRRRPSPTCSDQGCHPARRRRRCRRCRADLPSPHPPPPSSLSPLSASSTVRFTLSNASPPPLLRLLLCALVDRAIPCGSTPEAEEKIFVGFLMINLVPGIKNAIRLHPKQKGERGGIQSKL
jgi:hypothetical protein